MPGSAEWLLARITLRTEHRIRKVLRRVEREADAQLVLLWLLTDVRPEVVSSSGDINLMPSPFPKLESTVPSLMNITTCLGDVEPAVVQQVVVGTRVEKLMFAVIAPGPANREVLLRMAESAAEVLEEIIVDAVAA